MNNNNVLPKQETLFYEEKIVNGNLLYRNRPDSRWFRYNYNEIVYMFLKIRKEKVSENPKYEERIVNGCLLYRNDKNSRWFKYSYNEMTYMLLKAREEDEQSSNRLLFF
jgi:hypothetical protein